MLWYLQIVKISKIESSGGKKNTARERKEPCFADQTTTDCSSFYDYFAWNKTQDVRFIYGLRVSQHFFTLCSFYLIFSVLKID